MDGALHDKRFYVIGLIKKINSKKKTKLNQLGYVK